MEISGKRVLITGASRGLALTLGFAFGAAARGKFSPVRAKRKTSNL